jgi:hypothetical protein
MRERAKVIVVGIVALAAGVALGFVASSWVSYRMSQPLPTATGQQALAVLTLLDKKDEATLRRLMEMEIDGTLLTLRTMDRAQHFEPKDPMSRLYGDLKQYRQEHPRVPVGERHSYVPKAGFVPDAATAIRVAVAVWTPIYSSATIDGEKPYNAALRGDVWVVSGSLPAGWHGGVAEAEISRDSGCILRVSHGK